MFCVTCGREVGPEARFCDNCGSVIDRTEEPATNYAPGEPQPVQPGYGSAVNIPNYLVQAILVTIFCCLPAGVVAIVFAAQVNGKVAEGNLPEARRLSRNARIWCWVSFGVGLAIGIIYAAVIIAAIIAGFALG
ncbi:MAG: CD225/dispanin family protein [Chloroflexi bacterium]|nr:CD225/dispanin family protein [Chloroflexota bacterium]